MLYQFLQAGHQSIKAVRTNVARSGVF